MISLQNLGDSILFTFEENDKYLHNGTIEVPFNSLILVTDDSEMATFRKAATNDIFVSALYSDFGMTKAELEEWYAENMVSEVTEEDVDEKIAEAVGEESERAVSAETALSGAIDAVDAAYKAADSVISGAVDNLSTALQNESQRAVSAETSLSGAIDTKIDESAITSAITSASTDSEIPSAKAVYDALQESGLDEDTEKLISGSLNDLNERKLDASAYTPTDLTNYYTKSETSGATEIATALSGKQDTLIAGDNITISGNVISAEGGDVTVDTSLDSGSTNAVANSAVSAALNYNTMFLYRVDAKKTWEGHPTGAIEVRWRNPYNGSTGSTQEVFSLMKINNIPLIEDRVSGISNLNLVETSAITTSVTSASTDSQVPSAKAVYDALQEGGGGSTFDENYQVLEKQNWAREVEYQPLTSFTENSIYVKPYEGYNECRITIEANIDGEEHEAIVNLYLTGSTVYSLYDGDSALLDYVTIQRDNGYIKITQTASTDVEVINNTNSEFYFVPYIIESGSTEDAIKQAAQKTLDEAVYCVQNFVASIDNIGFDNEDLRLYYSYGTRNQDSISFTDFLTKDGEIYNNNGLKIKPVVNSGVTTWSTIFEVPDGKEFDSYDFPNYIDGTYKKFRVYYNSGVTFDDDENIQLVYHYGYGDPSADFYYDGNQDTFVTEKQDFTCTKQNYYLEFEYIGSNSSFKFNSVNFVSRYLNVNNFYRIDVYGKQLLNLQEAYESVSSGGASYSAGTGIDITNDVISVTGKVDTSAITTSVTSSSTDSQVPSAKAVNDKLGGLSLVKLTQAAYDALATKDSNTLYIING